MSDAILSETVRVFGPKPADHPSVGRPCPSCGVPFVAGDYTALIPLRPADEEEARRAYEGRPYNAVAQEVHAACAGAEVPS